MFTVNSWLNELTKLTWQFFASTREPYRQCSLNSKANGDNQGLMPYSICIHPFVICVKSLDHPLWLTLLNKYLLFRLLCLSLTVVLKTIFFITSSLLPEVSCYTFSSHFSLHILDPIPPRYIFTFNNKLLVFCTLKSLYMTSTGLCKYFLYLFNCISNLGDNWNSLSNFYFLFSELLLPFICWPKLFYVPVVF